MACEITFRAVMHAQTNVLIVEDDGEIARLVADYLEANGYRVVIARDGAAMDRALVGTVPDIVLLDIMLPGESGLSIAKRLRAERALPVIMLTAAGEEADRVVGLEIGADDYIAKPFSLRELLARIRAVLRRSEGGVAASQLTTTSFVFDGWVLAPHMRELTDPFGVKVALTGAEFVLLQALCEHPRRVLTRDQLLDLTQGSAASAFDRSIDTLISRIRRKIEQDPRDPVYVKTVRLGGYMFTPEVKRQ
ncbi:MAG: response regulator [Devosia sp.]